MKAPQVMDKFLIKRKATGDSSSTPNNNNVDRSKQSRMEINLPDLPTDPGLRIRILDYNPNIRDEVRRAYLLKGPCQPRSHDFPYTAFGQSSSRSLLNMLLVASMQSICLEGYGGENSIDRAARYDFYTTYVKCLRCHHESERYENMMDLTLEIFGWVESLEDALSQFTSSEDLDGENMYRCARNDGNYGKIDKCITFPDMLDMIAFMTGTDDIPPLYMLYAVVVHLDTSNASFSGHYISYVKDLHGNWFKVDDTEVRLVDLSQVVSKAAYILFYMSDKSKGILKMDSMSSIWNFSNRRRIPTSVFMSDLCVHLTSDSLELGIIFSHYNLKWYFAVLQIFPQRSIMRERERGKNKKEKDGLLVCVWIEIRKFGFAM
ncbi:ubiquitin-specific protease ubp15 [Orobanche hederae]